MKNTKGIACKVNHYHVTATAIVDGEVKSYTFDTYARDARAAKKSVAEALDIPASKVLVDFKLEKREFVIDCGYDELINALEAAHIGVTFKDASDKDTEK